MYMIVLILLIIASILITLVVLVQNSKGGGLASNFSSSNQVMGVRRTTDFLEKATWTLAIIIFLFCIVATHNPNSGSDDANEAGAPPPTEQPVPPAQ